MPPLPRRSSGLPGVAVERDQGEGRYIQIRGGAAQNTQVTFNGEQIPSPEPEIRQVELDAVPVDVLESIEVSKAITPDMDADAIGGAVNLVSKKAPDLPLFFAGGGRRVRADPGGLLGQRFGHLRQPFRRRTVRHAAVGLLQPAELRIGRRGAGVRYRRPAASRTTRSPAWTNATTPYGASASAATGNFDYRLSENSTLTLTGIFSDLGDEEQRQRVTNGVEDGELVFLTRTGWSAPRPGTCPWAGTISPAAVWAWITA